MQVLGSHTYKVDDEVRTLSWGTGGDGSAHVLERSEGSLTESLFGCPAREVELAFTPSGAYGLDDVERTVELSGEGCFASDLEDELTQLGIPFTREVRSLQAA
ncbi:MAG: hypothetical protein LKF00_09250 [Olsenella sp.]|jgi:hypothetical protein|nr:hypothetical protein [Olsenella sp.]MCI1289066.1 hypothetical protein [Olsenella sp.]